MVREGEGGAHTQVARIHDERLAQLSAKAHTAWWITLVDLAERFIDPFDAVRRFFTARSTMRKLRRQTASLSEAALTMQGLYARQKGGWLLASILRRG